MASQFGLGPAAIDNHRRNHLPQILARAAQAAVARADDDVLQFALAHKTKRLDYLQRDHDLLERLRLARGADMIEAPGGDTGLLVRRYKSIGQGPDAEKVTEYELDPVLLRERRRIEEQAARELGQLGPEAAGKRGGGGGLVVVVVPCGLPAGVVRVSRPVQMDIPGRMALPEPDIIDVEPEQDLEPDLEPEQPNPSPAPLDLF